MVTTLCDLAKNETLELCEAGDCTAIADTGTSLIGVPKAGRPAWQFEQVMSFLHCMFSFSHQQNLSSLQSLLSFSPKRAQMASANKCFYIEVCPTNPLFASQGNVRVLHKRFVRVA